MKRIVFLTGTGYLREGGEFSLVDVIRNVNKSYRVLCVCKTKGELSDVLESYGVEVLFCDLKWSRKFKYFFYQYLRFFWLFLQLKKISPELIYSNSGRINPFAARLASGLKVPLITHVRDLFDKVSKDKFSFKESTQIIACSKTIAKLVQRFNNNINVVYNGVDPQRFFPVRKLSENTFRGKLNLKDNFLIGNVGTIAYRKGYFEFAKAAKEILKTIPKARFVVIGETLPDREYILKELKIQIQQDGLEDKFIFTGFVKNVEEIIRNLNVLLFPPHYEAFGRVIIEAFASRVPVISTYSGGPEEIITDTKDGFLFKTDDTDGMASAVVKLYEDENLYNVITENAYQKFLKMFTIEEAAKQIKNTIDKTIEETVNV